MIGADGTLYVSSGDTLFAINPDGSEKWRFKTDYNISSATIGANGTIYISSSESLLYSLNPDGSEKWSFSVDGKVYPRPVIGEDGTIYIGSRDHNLYAIGGFESTDISGKKNIPTEFHLQANYPNPFNPSTNIKFHLPKSTSVTLSVYNTIGQQVTTMINRRMNSGTHTVQFNGSGLTSGMYIYRITAGEFTDSKTMMLLK